MGVLDDARRALQRGFYRLFYKLNRLEFCGELLPLVAEFECGSEEWETPLAEWISSGLAIEDMRPPRSSKVWLYKHRGQIVGYGSLGKTRRPYPTATDPHRIVAIIPMVAIQSRFQGKPLRASKQEKFSGQILYDLISEARKLGLPDLILYVDPRNVKAKKLYHKWDFTMLGRVRSGYEMMAMKLS